MHISAFESEWPKDYTGDNVFIIQALFEYCKVVGAAETLKSGDWWVPDMSVDRCNDAASDDERLDAYWALRAISWDRPIEWRDRRHLWNDSIPSGLAEHYFNPFPVIGKEEWRIVADAITRGSTGAPSSILEDLIRQFASGKIPTRYRNDAGEMIDIPPPFWNRGIGAALAIFREGLAGLPQSHSGASVLPSNPTPHEGVPVFVGRRSFAAWMKNYKGGAVVDEPSRETISDEEIKHRIMNSLHLYKNKKGEKSDFSQYRSFCKKIAEDLGVSQDRVLSAFESLEVKKGVGRTKKFT